MDYNSDVSTSLLYEYKVIASIGNRGITQPNYYEIRSKVNNVNHNLGSSTMSVIIRSFRYFVL